VDGKPIGQVQQDQRLTVDVGTGQHTIDLTKQGYTPKRITRNFEPGQTVGIEGGDALLSPDQNAIEETRRREEQTAWDAVNKGDRASLQQFLDSHANGRFANDARAQIARLDQAKLEQQRREEEQRKAAEQKKATQADEQKKAQAEEQRRAVLAAQQREIRDAQIKAAEQEQQRKKLEAAQAQQRAKAETQAVLDALKKYAAAYNNRDAEAVRAIYPGVEFKKVQAFFKASHEIRATLVNEEPKISGDTATVRSQLSILFADERGKKHPQPDTTVTFVLRNIGGSWQIQSVQ
jgi:ketosteroid isomerase-like protein